LRKQYFISLVAMPLFVVGCAAEPPAPTQYINLYGQKQGIEINLKSAVELAKKLDFKKGDLESNAAFELRKNQVISDIDNDKIMIPVTGEVDVELLAINRQVTNSPYKRGNEFEGKIVYFPFNGYGSECKELTKITFTSASHSSKYNVCNTKSTFSKIGLTISAEDAAKIGDINNLGLAVYGKLAAPYFTAEKSPSYQGYYYTTYTFFMENPLWVAYDKRSNRTVNVFPY
jgi:hypothetical protein